MQISSYTNKEFKKAIVNAFINEYSIIQAFLLREGVVYNPTIHKFFENFKYTHNSALAFSNSKLYLNTPLPSTHKFVYGNMIILDNGSITHGPYLINNIIDTATIEIRNTDGSTVTSLSLQSNVYSIKSNDLLHDSNNVEVSSVQITNIEIIENNYMYDIEVVFPDITFTPITYNFKPTSGMIVTADNGLNNIVVFASMLASSIALTVNDSITFDSPILRL